MNAEMPADFLGTQIGGNGAEAGAPAPAPPLPCLSSGNCNEGWFSPYTDTDIRRMADEANCEKTLFTPHHRKIALSIAENIQCLVRKYGLERIGFLTLTTPEGEEWDEFQARFHSLGVRVLPALFQAWLTVFEFSKSGRLHAHLIVACRVDIRTGFDFAHYLESVKGTTPLPQKRRLIRLAAENCPNLRGLWDELRQCLPVYGFGRHELIPVRTTAEGVARYVGGYIKKCVMNRTEENKRRRFVRYSKGWREWSAQFGWASPGGWVWREKLRLFVEALYRLHYDVKVPNGFKELFGPRWAYHLKEIIAWVPLPEYPTPGHALADGVSRLDLECVPSDATCLRGFHPFPSPELTAVQCA